MKHLALITAVAALLLAGFCAGGLSVIATNGAPVTPKRALVLVGSIEGHPGVGNGHP